jgi:hypothetical protein
MANLASAAVLARSVLSKRKALAAKSVRDFSDGSGHDVLCFSRAMMREALCFLQVLFAFGTGAPAA